jgi:HD-like signal output (HDOD) protein/ActR/RegA family two-component response regulator
MTASPPVTDKQRILFVDDEPAILAALRNLLYKDRHRWDLVFVSGGDDALAALRAKPADVVVSDMRMPGMDGATLLNQIKLEFPATARIMLSGHADREAIVRALPALHQLLSKPCDAATLRGAIERGFSTATGSSRDLELRAAIGRIDKLPSPPAVVAALSRALASPATQLAEIAAIVSRDPGLSAKVLQLVNSAYFGGQKTSSIAAAVALLGTDQLRFISDNAPVFGQLAADPFPGFSVEVTQERSVRAARMARAMLAEAYRDEVYAAALLHDVGRVALALGLADYRGLVERARATGRPIEAVEHDELGVTHADVGACLLGLWGLPNAIVELVRHHHAPDGAPAPLRELACAVHVADALADPDGLHELDLAAVERAGFVAALPRWRDAAAAAAA